MCRLPFPALEQGPNLVRRYCHQAEAVDAHGSIADMETNLGLLTFPLKDRFILQEGKQDWKRYLQLSLLPGMSTLYISTRSSELRSWMQLRDWRSPIFGTRWSLNLLARLGIELIGDWNRYRLHAHQALSYSLLPIGKHHTLFLPLASLPI